MILYIRLLVALYTLITMAACELQTVSAHPRLPIQSQNLIARSNRTNGTVEELNATVRLSVLQSRPTVRDVEIRFVNSNLGLVDRQGKPIQGRIPQSFIAREIQLKPGDVFDEDRVQADLRQLQQLGLFERVTVSLMQADDKVDVIYNIQERKASSIEFNPGNNDDVGVSVGVGYRNLAIGRLPQRLEVNTQVSLRDVLYDVRFISPYRAAAPNSLGYGLRVFRDRDVSDIFDRGIDLPNGNRVRERRFGGGLTFTRPLNEWQAVAGLNFTRNSTRDRNGNLAREDARGNPLTISGTGIDDLYTVSFGVTRDRRDNPFVPLKGSILTLGTEQSIPLGVGHIVLNRLVSNYIQYVPVRLFSTDAQNNKLNALPEVFAYNLQLGTVLGELPPVEAFRLGGRNSVRGYDSGRLGTGRSYALASGEYRFPLFSRVGGVIFADFASDLGTANSIIGRPAVVRNKPGSGFGAGIGGRWRSPFGLIRLDIGVSDRGDVGVYFGTGERF